MLWQGRHGILREKPGKTYAGRGRTAQNRRVYEYNTAVFRLGCGSEQEHGIRQNQAESLFSRPRTEKTHTFSHTATNRRVCGYDLI